MSDFGVKVEKIYVSEHPNADALEIGRIGSSNGWQVVVKKGLYRTGDYVAYIGENSVVPKETLKKYGFWNYEKGLGLLSGKKGDRVKMVKLRGEHSLGICIPIEQCIISDVILYKLNDTVVTIGDDVKDLLGVTKYEPPIPIQLAGEVFNAGQDVGVHYDISDIKNYPDELVDGENVQITVKLHGTNCSIVCVTRNGLIRNNIDEWMSTSYPDARVIIGSKGLSAQGLFFKDNENNNRNLYLNTVRGIVDTIADYSLSIVDTECITFVGELFGSGVQTGFDYGCTKPMFRVFDVYHGYRNQGRYLNDDELDRVVESTGISRAPVVYRGSYSYDILDNLANDSETEFNCSHVREGVVVKPIVERKDSNGDRVAYKHRSIAYMTKSTGEEFN